MGWVDRGPPANDEMVEGYIDGFKSDLPELPDGNNRPRSYQHGWRNGRDDRIGRPRAPADVLRIAADDAMRMDAN